MFWILTAAWAIGLVASGIAPYDRATWLMEVMPAILVWPVLFATRQRFRFSDLAMALITLHGLILMLGGAYTYARTPLGFWLQDWLHLDRNPYDRIGHFAQGFVPAIVARELLLRIFRLENRRLVAFMAVCVCMTISACYELVEWAAAVIMGEGADEFLGTQGDQWDTQSDMFMALIGALAALLLAPWHDRRMKAV